jgi:hypothetical protein
VLAQQASHVAAHVGIVVDEQDAAVITLVTLRRVQLFDVGHPTCRILDVRLGHQVGIRPVAWASKPILGQMSGPHRHTDGEGRALPYRSTHVDRAPVQFHQLADQRKSDTGARRGHGLRRASAMVPVKDPRDLVLRDPDPSVGDLEHGPVAVSPDPHSDLAAQRELQRVRDQVEDDLLPH